MLENFRCEKDRGICDARADKGTVTSVCGF